MRVRSNGDYWQLSYQLPDGTRSRESLGRKSTIGGKKDAERLATQRIAERGVMVGRVDPTTLLAWRDAYRLERTDLNAKTLADQVAAIDRLIGVIGNKRVRDVGAEHARQFVNHLRDAKGRDSDKLSANTIAGIVARLGVVFEFAVNRSTPLATRNPFAKKALRTHTLNIAAGGAAGWSYVSQAQADAIAGYITNPTAFLAFHVARRAGLRREEIRNLRWTDVQWHNNVIHIPIRAHNGRTDRGTKQRDRFAPMDPTLAGLLLKAQNESYDDGPCRGFREHHARIIDKARIEAGIADYGKPLHTLRKSLATDWIRGGASFQLVAEALGDTEETVKKYYYERFPMDRIASLVTSSPKAIAALGEKTGEKCAQDGAQNPEPVAQVSGK
jgi:integrase